MRSSQCALGPRWAGRTPEPCSAPARTCSSADVAAGAKVVIRAIDGNDRQIDNGKPGPDRMQIIEGVLDESLAGQMLRMDVTSVKAR